MQFPLMSTRSLFGSLLFALMAVPAFLPAQEEISSKEEERLENLARDNSEWSAPKNSLTVGFRVLSSGVNVRFGNLGNVPLSTTVAPATDGLAQRVYNNGTVNVDALRAAEKDANGVQTSTPGGRYQTFSTSTTDVVDANGVVTGTVTTVVQTGDFLSYTPGLTRDWSYATPEQAVEIGGRPYVSMSSYSAASEGAMMDKKQGPSAGVELQLNHVIGRLSRRTEWSFVAGLALNGINNKTSGDVQSTLVTNTDFYSLHDQPAPVTSPSAPYTAPSGMSDPAESTVPISALPDSSQTSVVAGAATVHGRWQVKGAYFMMRVGPSVHTQLTERLGLSASMGVAGAYAGTHYSAAESLDIPNVGSAININEASDANKFLAGYYADFNMDFMANERMGLFGGVSAQKFGDYSQTLDTRTARIDIGTSVGLRGGVTIKF